MLAPALPLLLLLAACPHVSRAQYPLRDPRGASLNLLGQNPCVSKQTCAACLQTPTCAWCSQPGYAASDGSPLPRCNQEEFYIMSSRWVDHQIITLVGHVYLFIHPVAKFSRFISFNFFQIFAGFNVRLSTSSTRIIFTTFCKTSSLESPLQTARPCSCARRASSWSSGSTRRTR